MLNVELDHILDENKVEVDIRSIIEHVENNDEVYIVNKEGKPSVAIVNVDRFIKYGHQAQTEDNSQSEDSMNNESEIANPEQAPVETEQAPIETEQAPTEQAPTEAEQAPVETKQAPVNPEEVEVPINRAPLGGSINTDTLPPMPSFDDSQTVANTDTSTDISTENSPQINSEAQEEGFKFNLPPLDLKPSTTPNEASINPTPTSNEASQTPTPTTSTVDFNQDVSKDLDNNFPINTSNGIFGAVTITPNYPTQPTNQQTNEQTATGGNSTPEKTAAEPKIFNLSPLSPHLPSPKTLNPQPTTNPNPSGFQAPQASPNMAAIPPQPIQPTQSNGQMHAPQYNPDGTIKEEENNQNNQPPRPIVPNFVNPKIQPHPDALIETNSDPSNSSPLA